MWYVKNQYPDLHYSDVFCRNWCKLVLAQKYYNDLVTKYKLGYPEEMKDLELIPIKNLKRQLAQLKKMNIVYSFNID